MIVVFYKHWKMRIRASKLFIHWMERGMFMELCYNLQTCSGTSTIEKDLSLCAKVGFSSIEIDFAKAQAYLRTHSMSELGDLIKMHGLKCASINAIFDLNFCTNQKWRRICEQFDFACELGDSCGADKVIVLSSERSTLPEGTTDAMIFDDTVAVLNRLADRGLPHGMNIAFEPVGTMAVGNIKTAWEIVRRIDRPEVGIVLDDFNMFLWDVGSDFDDILHIEPGKIFIAHINDAERIPFARIDQMHRCMPGDGRIDVVRYVDNLRAIDYDGVISVEVLNPGIWRKGPDVVIPEAYEKLRRYVD